MIQDNFLKAAATGILIFATFVAAGPAAKGASNTAQTSADSRCAGLPPGKHSLLERMAASYHLTCDQQLKIEVLLHDEESVTKPLLRFTSMPTADKRQIMSEIKLAARRQIRPLLTPQQQKLMDKNTLMTGGTKKGRKGGGKKRGKNGSRKGNSPSSTDPLADEETLSKAVTNYAAFSPEEKKSIVLQVKRAARSDANLQLTPGERQKLDMEIREESER